MPIIAAKCPGCNGDIQLDDAQKTGFCMYCGTRVIVQDIIEMRNDRAAERAETLERLLQNGEQFLALGEFVSAIQTFRKAANDYPADYRGWWGDLRASTSNFGAIEVPPDTKPVERTLENAMKLAPEGMRASMRQQYDDWLKKGNACYESRILREQADKIRARAPGNEQYISGKQAELDRHQAEYEKFQRRTRGWSTVMIISIVVMVAGAMASRYYGTLAILPAVVFLIISINKRKQNKAMAAREYEKVQGLQKHLSEMQSSHMDQARQLAEAQRRLAELDHLLR